MANNYTTITSTTQDFLEIYDITNNLIILRDGSVSAVLTVSAMNFGLLAEQEQDAVIYTYAALLNSLNYPIQIVIQSQTKDATAYLELLRQQQDKASNDKKRRLIERYRVFISQLIKERNVLDKKFYVTIPASALELGFVSADGMLPGKKPFDISSVERSVILERAISILEPRIAHMISQFARIGLFARQIETQEIIQVFYNNYNPEATEGQQLTNTNNYTTALVRASVTGAGMSEPSQTVALPTNSPVQGTQTSEPQTASVPTSPVESLEVSPQPAPTQQMSEQSVEPAQPVETPVGVQPTPSAATPEPTPAVPPTLPGTPDLQPSQGMNFSEPIVALDQPAVEGTTNTAAAPSSGGISAPALTNPGEISLPEGVSLESTQPATAPAPTVTGIPTPTPPPIATTVFSQSETEPQATVPAASSSTASPTPASPDLQQVINQSLQELAPESSENQKTDTSAQTTPTLPELPEI